MDCLVILKFHYLRSTNGIPSDNQMDTQVRLGKSKDRVRLEEGKVSTGEEKENNNPSFLAESEKSEAEEVPDYIKRSEEYYRSHNLPEPDWLVRAKAFHPEGGGI